MTRKIISVQIPSDILEKIEARCRPADNSISSIIREALVFYFEKTDEIYKKKDS